MDQDSALFVHSIAKAFKVLHAFDGPIRHMTLADLATASGLGRSAVQRIVHTLETLGYLHRVPNSKAYGVSSRMLGFACNYVRSHELIARSMPFLQGLRSTFGETVNLQELDGTEIVLVARVVSPQLMNVRVSVGSRLPAFCTASGNAILSRLPVDWRDRVLAESALVPMTPHTVVEPAALVRRIEKAAMKGYSIMADQAAVGDIAIAAPVIGPDGQPIAAVNISAPSSRWTLQRAEAEMAKHIRAAAHSLSMS